MKYTKTKKTIISVFVSFLIVVLDQLTKYHISTSMTPYADEKKVLSDLLVLRFIKNTGAAWGSFSSMTSVLIIISIILIIGLGVYYFKIINDDKKRVLRLLISFVIGGAIGNLIDRICYGYVIDFIYVKCINFPVFNVADIFVTVSMFLIIFIVLFSKEDEESGKETLIEKETVIDSKKSTDKNDKMDTDKKAEIKAEIKEEIK